MSLNRLPRYGILLAMGRERFAFSNSGASMLPDDRKYTKDGLWVKKVSDDEFVIGATPQLLKPLGVLIYVDLPDVDDEAMVGLPIGEIEGENEIAELMAPLNGLVTEVNEVVFDDLDLLASDPMEAAWLLRLKANTPPQFDELLDAAAASADAQPGG